MYDVVIIGSGPGGYVSAIRSAQLGLKTAVIEHRDLGGICLNWGCIPTKSLLRSAEIFRYIKKAKTFGLQADVTFDFQQVMERSRSISKKLSTGVSFLLKKNNISYIDGWGKIKKTGQPHFLEIEKKDKSTQEISSKNIILATGARARCLSNCMPDHDIIWDYQDVLQNTSFPDSILIIGSGAIGVEFASFFATFGSNVTIVEMQPYILPLEDREISSLMHKQLEKNSIRVLTETVVEGIQRVDHTVNVVLKNKERTYTIRVDRVLSAVGISGNVENLGLEKTKIQVKNTHIVVNQYNETGEKNVYAIGDVAGPPWLAHKASHEGILCAERIAGYNPHILNPLHIPSCIYANPQIASVGLTEESAKKLGLSVKIGRFPCLANGKAIVLGEEEGMIKTIFDDKTGELLGAHMIGSEVTELIHGYSIGQTLETTEDELIRTVFPHPTLSEMLHESVLNAYGRSIHI